MGCRRQRAMGASTYSGAMVSGYLAEPTERLLDRVGSFDLLTPDRRALQSDLLDDYARTDRAERRQIDRTAHMMLHLDDPGRVLELGLDFLVDELGTARADAALLDPTDEVYRPSAVITDNEDDRKLIASTPLSGHALAIRQLWRSPGPVAFERVRGNHHIGELEPTLVGLGVTAMVTAPIRFDVLGLGLLCLDEVEGERRFTHREQRKVERFVNRYLAPVLFSALRGVTNRRSALTSAEEAAVRLLADGLSYDSIARTLGKSPRTIDNQLRSARRKAGAHNAVELVRWWQHLTANP